MNTPPPLPQPPPINEKAQRSWAKIITWYIFALLVTGALSSVLRGQGLPELPSNIIGIGLFILALTAPLRQSSFLNLPVKLWVRSKPRESKVLWWTGHFLILLLPILRLYQFANPPSDTAWNHLLGFLAQLSSLGLGLLLTGLFFLNDPVVLSCTALSIFGLFILIRRHTRRHGQLPGWIYAVVLFGLFTGNATLDINPNLFMGQIAIIFFFAGNRRRGREGTPLALGGIYLLGTALIVFYLEQRAVGHAASSAAILFVVAASYIYSGFRIHSPERKLTWLLLCVAATQVFASIQPLLLGAAANPTLVSTSSAYGYCEDTRDGTVWMTFPSCSAFPKHRVEQLAHEQCRAGTVQQFDLRQNHPSTLIKHAPFSPDYFGRLEQPVCLDDRIMVGMTDVVVSGQKLTGSTLSIAKTNGELLQRHHYATEVGHTLASATWSPWIYAVDEFSSMAQRYSPNTGKVEAFATTLDNASLTLDGQPFSDNRHSLFISEHYFGDEVVEFDLAHGDEKARYLHNNGGTWATTVDDATARLFVSGMWSLDVYDLRTGTHIKRYRTGFGSRAVMPSPENQRIYLPCTIEGTIRVFDRRDLEELETVPVGLGIRNLFINPATRGLVGATTNGTFLWNVDDLP